MRRSTPEAEARLLGPSDPDGVTVNDHQCSSQLHIWYFSEKSLKCFLGFLNRCWPNMESNNAGMGADWKGSLIREIFIEGDDDGLSALCPDKDLFIRLSGQGDI